MRAATGIVGGIGTVARGMGVQVVAGKAVRRKLVRAIRMRRRLRLRKPERLNRWMRTQAMSVKVLPERMEAAAGAVVVAVVAGAEMVRMLRRKRRRRKFCRR
jgi:hypothetical protein